MTAWTAAAHPGRAGLRPRRRGRLRAGRPAGRAGTGHACPSSASA